MIMVLKISFKYLFENSLYENLFESWLCKEETCFYQNFTYSENKCVTILRHSSIEFAYFMDLFGDC